MLASMVCAEAVRRAIAGSAVLLAVTSCGVTSPTATAPEFYFPRHGGTLGGGDTALLEGIAVMGDGCLLLQTADGTRYLPLWPQNTRLGKINNLPAILGPDQELLVEVGDIDPNDRVELAGSAVPRDQPTR